MLCFSVSVKPRPCRFLPQPSALKNVYEMESISRKIMDDLLGFMLFVELELSSPRNVWLQRTVLSDNYDTVKEFMCVHLVITIFLILLINDPSYPLYIYINQNIH